MSAAMAGGNDPPRPRSRQGEARNSEGGTDLERTPGSPAGHTRLDREGSTGMADQAKGY
jgi:hypothetical protein